MKTAVIIKGNPKYLNKYPTIANNFYKSIEAILTKKGFKVSYDQGLPYTRPDISADVWVAHSRGIDRLQYAEFNTKTVELTTKSDDGDSVDHYILSLKDICNLSSL